MSPPLNIFIGKNWANRPSNRPASRDRPGFRYFQSWSPKRKCAPWNKKIRFRAAKATANASQNSGSAFRARCFSQSARSNAESVGAVGAAGAVVCAAGEVVGAAGEVGAAGAATPA